MTITNSELLQASLRKYGRLSARRASELGYLPARVFVNGEEIFGCHEFDDSEGWADVYAYDEKGRPILSYNELGLINGQMSVRLSGDIVYIPKHS